MSLHASEAERVSFVVLLQQELEENVEYVEKEDEFDVVVDSQDPEGKKRKAEEEQEMEETVVSIEAVDTVRFFRRCHIAARKHSHDFGEYRGDLARTSVALLLFPGLNTNEMRVSRSQSSLLCLREDVGCTVGPDELLRLKITVNDFLERLESLCGIRRLAPGARTQKETKGGRSTCPQSPALLLKRDGTILKFKQQSVDIQRKMPQKSGRAFESSPPTFHTTGGSPGPRGAPVGVGAGLRRKGELVAAGAVREALIVNMVASSMVLLLVTATV